MQPSRGAKRILLQLDKPDNSKGGRQNPQPSRPLGAAEQAHPAGAQQGRPLPSTRPFSNTRDTPLRRQSLWHTGVNTGNDEQKREAVKSQLESITGRMFALLDDYEDEGTPSTSKLYIEDLSQQVNQIENSELRGNIQLMLQDYNDMCAERDELLFSLQDWFEEGHIDDLIEEMHDSGEDSETVRKSLMESKLASERLKEVNRELDGKSGSQENSELLQEKMELEKELMKSKQAYDSLHNGKDSSKPEGQNQEVTHSWKFAAQDIFSVLTKVRNDGLLDVHELEEQVKRLVSSMNEQARYIETIKDELRRQRELVEHEEFLRRKLQEEHEMLDEDLEDVRRRLREKDKKLTAAEEQVKQLKKQLGSQDRRVSHVQNSRRSSAAGSAAGNGGERMRAQLDQLMTKYSSLSEEHKKVVQERDELQITLKEVQAKLNEVKSDQLDVSQSETKHSSPNPPSNPPSNPSFNPPTNPPQNPPSNPSTNPPTHPSSDPQSDGGKMDERGKAKDRSISHGTSPKAAKKEQNTSKIRELEGLVQVLKEDRGRVESQAVEKERLLSVARQEAQNARQELELSANQNHHLQRLNKVLEEKVKSLERALAENGKPVPPSFEFQSPSSEFKTPTPNTAVSEVPTPPTPRLTDPQTGGPPQAVSPVEEGGDSRTSSVRLVAEMLEKLNTNSNGLEDVESSSLKIIKEEMNTMCANIQAFMDYSTDLIGREAVAVEDATESLQKKLREAGTGDATPPPRPSSSDSSDAKHGELNTSNKSAHKDKMAAFKMKVQTIGQQVIDTLKTSEKLFSQNISHQRKRLNSVVMAMAEHKGRQPPSWKFPLSEEEGLVLNATPLHRPLSTAISRIHRESTHPHSGLRRRQRSQHFVKNVDHGTGWHNTPGVGGGDYAGHHITSAFSPHPLSRTVKSSCEDRSREGLISLPMLVRGTHSTAHASNTTEVTSPHSSAPRMAHHAHLDLSRLALLSSLRYRNHQRHGGSHARLGSLLSPRTHTKPDRASTAGGSEGDRLPQLPKKNHISVGCSSEHNSEQTRQKHPKNFLQAAGKTAFLDLVNHSDVIGRDQPSSGGGDSRRPRLGFGVRMASRRRQRL